MYEIFLKLLEKYGLTAYKVSKATGIAGSTFSDWKNGRSNPKQDKLQKIADYFGVSFRVSDDRKRRGCKEKPGAYSPGRKRYKERPRLLREKLANKESGPAAYDGQDIPEEDIDLFWDRWILCSDE